MAEVLNDAALEGELLQEVYQVEEKIGKGGNAWVYKALDLRTEEHVAIKVLFNIFSQDTEVKQRFLREGQIQSQIQHPHIVRVFDVFEERGLTGFALEWCDGGDLRSYLRAREVPFDNEQLTQLFLPVLDAVMYAHDHQIVHRDLKPANILLTQVDGVLVPKVTDFGIAKIFEDEGVTSTGSMMGTLRYIAPEQLKDSKHIDHRADVYSLGVMLYEWANGRPPFVGKGPQLFTEILGKPIPYPHQAPERFQDFLMQCLRKDPLYRFQSAALMKEGLLLAMEGEGEAGPPTLAFPSEATVSDRESLPTGQSTKELAEHVIVSNQGSSHTRSDQKTLYLVMGGIFIGLLLAGVLVFVGYSLSGMEKPAPPVVRKTTKVMSVSKPTPQGIKPSKAKVEKSIPDKAPKKDTSAKSPLGDKEGERRPPNNSKPAKPPARSGTPTKKSSRKRRARRRRSSVFGWFGEFRRVHLRKDKAWFAIFNHKKCEKARRLMGEGIRIDRYGNIYLLLSFRGEIRLGGKKFFSRYGGELLVKMSRYGKIFWTRLFDQVLGDSMELTSKGLWVRFRVEKGAQIGNYHHLSYQKTYVIARLTLRGKVKWALPLLSPHRVYMRGMVLGHKRSLYMWGEAFRTMSIAGKQASFKGTHIFLAKVNASGKAVWLKTLPKSRGLQLTSVAMAPSGDIYMTGAYRKPFTWDQKTHLKDTFGNRSVGFLMRLSGKTREVRWVKIFPRIYSRYVKVVASPRSGPLVVLSTSYQSGRKVYRLRDVNIPMGRSSRTLYLKMSQDGEILWFKKSVKWPKRVRLLRYSYYIVSSRTYSGRSTAGWFKRTTHRGIHSDLTLQRLSMKGKWFYSRKYGGHTSEIFSDFDVDRKGRVWVVGMYWSVDLKLKGRVFKNCKQRRNMLLFVKE